ncbi:hypothetical protein [Flavobacterium sp. C4GT6]|uniref:hypothetical protein n=1 Tax=Flavobacterium sp. C4GT6 TaxID=3103818 RepID=UPI002ED2A03A
MKIKNNILLAILVIFTYGCEDILEDDITNDNITMYYPLNNAEIESNAVNFQWALLDGADEYRIQVFSESNNMVLDSLVSTNHFIQPLNPGTYQWRVRGENFAYETAYTFPATFTLTTSDDLTNQQIVLSYPSSGFYTQNTSLTFSWTPVNAAEYYVFQLINVTAGNILIHEEPQLNNSSFTLTSGVITEDAQYSWKVKAVNSENETETQFSSRNFYIDTTIPNQSQNTLPLNSTSITQNTAVNFAWTAPGDTGVITSPLFYTIQIANDVSFNTIIQTGNVTTPAFEYTFTSTGDYYWRVKTKDQAGNETGYSDYFTITVTE